MVAKLPDDVIHRIKVRLDCGESIAQIRDATKVGKTTIACDSTSTSLVNLILLKLLRLDVLELYYLPKNW